MTRTVIESSYEEYLNDPHATEGESPDDLAAERQERQERLAIFPHSVVLQVAFLEMDYANRWCWQHFGPAHGKCLQSHSDYPACDQRDSHSHSGKWVTHWLAKTNYDFGYNEWFFAEKADHDRFIEFIPRINWGEHFE